EWEAIDEHHSRFGRVSGDIRHGAVIAIDSGQWDFVDKLAGHQRRFRIGNTKSETRIHYVRDCLIIKSKGPISIDILWCPLRVGFDMFDVGFAWKDPEEADLPPPGI